MIKLHDNVNLRNVLTRRVVSNEVADSLVFDALIDIIAFDVSAEGIAEFDASGDYILTVFVKAQLATKKLGTTKTNEVSQAIYDRLAREAGGDLLRLDMINAKGLNRDVLVEFKATFNLSHEAPNNLYRQDLRRVDITSYDGSVLY